MAIKHYKPTTNGRRGMSTLKNEEITSSTPTKSLLVKKSKTGGRNNQGKMTVRHIGGGAKRKYRVIDYKRNKVGVTGRAASLLHEINDAAIIDTPNNPAVILFKLKYILPYVVIFINFICIPRFQLPILQR